MTDHEFREALRALALRYVPPASVETLVDGICAEYTRLQTIVCAYCLTEIPRTDDNKADSEALQRHMIECEKHPAGLAISMCLGFSDRATAALELIRRFGGIDGEHHKTWVIDQVARALIGTPEAYAEFVMAARAGADGPETYDWNEGICP
jgi:hypothetical protein